MDVRMILERAAPGMEDAEEATPRRADVLGVGGQGFDRGAGRLEQCGIGDALVPRRKPRSPAGTVKVSRKYGHGSRRSIWFSSQALALSC